MHIKTVDVNTFKTWLDKGEAILIDVREQSEYQDKNIPGSILLPLGIINISQLPENKGKKMVLHCGSGGRSGKACEKLLSENPEIEVYNLEGGIKAWIATGNKVNNGSSNNSEESKFCLLSKNSEAK